MLGRWGWLLQCAGTQTWQQLYIRLHTGTYTRFCIVGGLDAAWFQEDEQQLSQAWQYSTCPNRNSTRHSLLRDVGVWEKIPAPQIARSMAAVVRDASGNLVVMGGITTVQHLATGNSTAADEGNLRTLFCVERFDGKEWSAMPGRLCQPRCCAAAAVDRHGGIFLAGGGESMYSQSRAFDSVEYLPAGHDLWRCAPHMSQVRSTPLGCL